MNRHIILTCLLTLLPRVVFSQDTTTEYGRLFTDLTNARTYGYKSTFVLETFRSVALPNLSQGSLERTGGASDLAITITGFFRLKSSDGKTVFTRNGQFSFNADGHMVELYSGFELEPKIVLPADFVYGSVVVDQHGEVTCKLPSGTTVDAGHIPIFEVSVDQLERSDRAHFQLKQELQPMPNPAARIQQRFLEMSNCDPLKTLTRMLFLLEEEPSSPSTEAKKVLVRSLVSYFLDAGRLTPEIIDEFSFLSPAYQ